MNIYRHELRMLRRFTWTWGGALAGVLLLFFSMFPALSADAEQFQALLAQYPEAVRQALGFAVNDIATLLGFYSFVFPYVLLAGAIQAIQAGAGILSKETREKTADFLLTKPITRPQIITAKLLAAATSLFLTQLLYLPTACLLASQLRDVAFAWTPFVLIGVSLLLVQLIFLALGMLASLLLPRLRSVLSLSLGTGFGFFFIGMLGSVVGERAVRYLTPFKYFDPAYIIRHSGYETSFVLLGVGIVVLAVGSSYLIYTQKDIPAV